MVDLYLEKVYAGFLGMNIGIRLGAPVESGVWTYDRILSTYGDIKGYVKDYKKFAADDDLNGPVFFLRALRDDPSEGGVTPGAVARTWLNYAREGVGLFWWGGYGISTEHTAYLNLKNGIPAPRSGSATQNGVVMAEQIGGQIFIDTWGLIHPGDPKAAADDAQAAASVSHDGEGLNGARFIAACIAAAFTEKNVDAVMDAGLLQIAKDSLYASVIKAVREFYRNNPDDWRLCRQMLEENWGYDKYPGVCHIIPNAGVCALAMLYGGGDFARTVEIATMCSWDTDCNAGNVGTILGVLNGLSGLPDHYRRPINDSLILSGISGYLNILDAPSYAKEVASFGLKIMGKKVPETWKRARDGQLLFDFELSGATHGFEVSDPFYCRIEQTGKRAYSGKGSLGILMDRMSRGKTCKIYYKPFYSRDAFSDERYSPVLTPQVYSGQKISMRLFMEKWDGWDTGAVIPYVRIAFDKKELSGGTVKLEPDQWTEVCFTVPDTEGRLIDEAGIIVTSDASVKSRTSGMIYLDDFMIDGNQDYTIDFAKQRKEFGTITPFSVDHGAWEIAGDKLSLMCCGEAFAYAGNYYAKDCVVSTTIQPLNGESHLLLVRAQGAMRFYAAGFEKDGLVIYKNHFGFEKLAEKKFNWEVGKEYPISLRAVGEEIILSVGGEDVLAASDQEFGYGMFGCGCRSMGRVYFGTFAVHAEI